MKDLSNKVVAAFILRDGKFLIAKRREGWEFPGGKVKKGEDEIKALKREIREELGVEIEVENLICEEKEKIKDKEYKFYFYKAKILAGEPKPKEHLDLKWISYDEFKNFKFLNVDEKFLYSMASLK